MKGSKQSKITDKFGNETLLRQKLMIRNFKLIDSQGEKKPRAKNHWVSRIFYLITDLFAQFWNWFLQIQKNDYKENFVTIECMRTSYSWLFSRRLHFLTPIFSGILMVGHARRNHHWLYMRKFGSWFFWTFYKGLSRFQLLISGPHNQPVRE